MKTKILTLLVATTGLLLSGCAEWDWQREYHPSRPVPDANKTTKTVKRERVRLPVEENDADEATRYEGLM